VPDRTDSRYLVDVAYADPSGLTARAALYDFQQPRIDLQAEAMRALGDIDGCTVVDVGCGDGRYVADLRGAGAHVIAVDLSKGMLDGISPPRPTAVVADAQHLPLADASVDVVLLMHMLYHVPRPALAVEEARRVLRDTGRALVAVNGVRHLSEMNAVWVPLLEEAGVRADVEDLGLVNPRVKADEARALLSAEFDTVRERTLASTVRVTDPGPVVRHAASTTGARTSPRLVDRFTAEVASRIAADGCFEVSTEVVMFVVGSS
jgi:SAM-dependent methyltransferase